MKVYSVWDTVHIFYYVVKFFGYICFSIDGKIEKGRIKSSVLDILMITFSNVCMLYVIYLNLTYDLSLISTKSFIIDNGTYLVTLFSITNVFMSSVINTIRRFEIWSVFKTFNNFDIEVNARQRFVKKISLIFSSFNSQMKTLSMTIDHKRFFKMFFILLVSLSAALLTFSAVTFYLFYGIIEREKFFYFTLTYFFCNGSSTMCLLTFILILYCFYARFDLINSCIKRHFATQEEDLDRNRKKTKQSRSKLIIKLADLHDLLVDNIDKINHCFAFQMMNIVGGVFAINIFSTFAMYRVFVQNDYQNFYKASIQYFWNIYFLIYGFFIIALSSLMTRTGKKTAVLVHKAINYIDNDEDPTVDTVS